MTRPMTMRSPVASPSLTASTTPRRCSSTASTCPSTSDSRSSPKLAAGQISGMVDAAAGAKVTVTVDGKSYVAIVGNAGAWTVRLPKALAPGSHKVTAVASLQSKGSDFATTGAAASRKFTL